ncbi:antitoxin Xre/MbcA/ParS toxin-binding domain-containing protein [Catenovulum sediminis]|uniref:Antitoxin Xre/MbcA/ParS toxin-binding domain-containing protein n=2 Tax=Catenovulum sediminis TaxID=1740262 RepID=A0ABV1RLD0_9ALTE|nr:antitoxin Xre/MbcA/ParS toxin-binding domain-containing protein [Catenovulum sediminis]
MKLKTRVYIDGYNLYYGRLKGTPFKWLNVHALVFNQILPSVLLREGEHQCTFEAHEPAINYFTAVISEKAARDKDSVSSQATYHSALRNHLKNNIEIINGYYSIAKTEAWQVDPIDEDTWPKNCNKVKIWKIEEKKSDVNLSLQAYHDSITGQIDHAVFITNDTDIAPSLSMIKQNTDVKIGLIIPSDKTRNPNKELVDLADWKRTYITDAELQSSQLPRVIQGKRKANSKPISWYPYPMELQKIIEAAKPVKPKIGMLFKWMEAPCEYLNGEKPIELINTEQGCKQVLDYINVYVKQNK